MIKIDKASKRNLIFLLVAQASAALLGVFAFTRIARELPVIEMGRFGFAVYSTALFGLLAELGIRFVAMKEIATSPENVWHYHRHSAYIRWLLAALSLILLSVVALTPAWRAEWNLLMLGGLLAITQFGSDPATWVFFGRGRIDIGATILIIDRFLYLVAIHIAAQWSPSAESLIIGAVTVNLLRMTFSACWVRMQIKIQPKIIWDKSLFRYLIVDGAAIGIAILTFFTYSQITIVLMKSFSTPEQLGYYAMAFGAMSVLLVIPTSLIMALFPIMATTLGKSIQANRDLFFWFTRLIMLVAVPIVIVLLLFADDILAIWMGAKYTPATLELKILAIALVFSAASFLYRMFLFASEKYKTEITINVSAILATIIIGIPICKIYGGIGVAIVYVFIEASVAITKAVLTWYKSSHSLSFISQKKTL